MGGYNNFNMINSFILAMSFTATTPSTLMVQLSATDYRVKESSGEMCMAVEANSTSTNPSQFMLCQ